MSDPHATAAICPTCGQVIMGNHHAVADAILGDTEIRHAICAFGLARNELARVSDTRDIYKDLCAKLTSKIKQIRQVVQ